MFVNWKPLYELAAARADGAMKALAEALAMVEKERARYDALLGEVLRRGLKDEKEPPVPAEPERTLPAVIQRALGQWPEGSAPYVANLQYAHAQLAIRPDDAEAIASEIRAGEDVEMYL